MGRKIDMKKIENTTKCQVTFSKRRSSLMKKANELSVCCDIEIAVVAFSPSGRVSKYSGPHKMDEVLKRYVNLPVEKRFNQINNVQGKMEKLKKLSSHINGDISKLHYLEKQIENLELQIQKKGLELQILETDLRDYEVIPGQEASLNQLLWCERNLNNTLQKVVSRKMELVQLECLTQTSYPAHYPAHYDQNPQTSLIPENPIAGELLMQLDPWISPLSAKVRESIFQDLVGQATEPLVNGNTWLPSASGSVSVSASENVSSFNPIHESPPISVSVSENVSNFNPIHESPPISVSASENVSNFDPIHESPPPFIPPEVVQQPQMMDQSILNFHDQNNVDAILKQSSMIDQPFNFQDLNNASGYCSSSVIFSDAMNMSTPDLCNIIQDPIFQTTANPNITTMGMTQNNEMGMEFQLMMSPFRNINGDGNNPFTNDQDFQDFGMINQIQETFQPQLDSFNPLFGEIGEENSLVWEPNQENSGLWDWEWEELLRDGDFNNFPNLP